jgi:hypothetical protein
MAFSKPIEAREANLIVNQKAAKSLVWYATFAVVGEENSREIKYSENEL